MKRLLLTISIVCLILVNYTAVNGAEWAYYGKDKLGNRFYYDEESVASGGNGIIKVWNKKVYSNKGKRDFIKSEKNNIGFKNISHTLAFMSYSCSTSEVGTTSFTTYSTAGNAIDSGSFPLQRIPVPPDSVLETLYNIV